MQAGRELSQRLETRKHYFRTHTHILKALGGTIPGKISCAWNEGIACVCVCVAETEQRDGKVKVKVKVKGRGRAF